MKMTINMIRRCKMLIAQPNYYRERALQMGEIFGAWVAEQHIASLDSPEYYHAWKMRHRYHHKLQWYRYKIKGTKYSEGIDYES